MVSNFKSFVELPGKYTAVSFLLKFLIKNVSDLIYMVCLKTVFRAYILAEANKTFLKS